MSSKLKPIDINALTLLSNSLTPGVFCGNQNPTVIPTPKQIQVMTTLLVHPLLTTRASDENKHLGIPSVSFTILQNILDTVGSMNASLPEIFVFERPAACRNAHRRQNPDEDVEGDSESSGPEIDIGGAVAQNGLWTCAQDFWHIVGWSFNCSVRYPKRWQYWKVLLDYLLTVLDQDWDERNAVDEELFQSKLETDPEAKIEYKTVRGSLLVKWLSHCKHDSKAMKRVVSAAFADGSAMNLRDFPEVFENETKEFKEVQLGQKRKRGEEIKSLGDYDEEDMMDLDSSETEDKSEHDQQDYSSPLGGSEAVALRQYLLMLVSIPINL